MDAATATRLIEINRQFYADFGPAFAATRRRIQDGVRRVLGELPDQGRWLDLGCGSGALAVEWLARGRRSAYHGLDFSESLLNEAASATAAAAAERAAQAPDPPLAQVSFALADLGQSGWSAGLVPDQPSEGWRGVLCFAALHHIPSTPLRQDLLREVLRLLAPGGWFVHSEWQFQNAPRLMARRLPWSTVGLDESQLDPGDTLLDWRYTLPGQPEQTGLRYVHLFTREELADLARSTDFRIREEFESDGQGGRLGLYQIWEAVY